MTAGPPTQPGPITVTGTTMNSATLTWGQSGDTLGVEGYEITRQRAGDTGTPPIVATTDGGVTHYNAQHLYAGTGYTFGVVAIDTAGRTSTPQTAVVTTSANPSNSAPLPPADSSVSAKAFSATRIDVVWAASPSIDVSGYQVLRDGTALPGGRLDLPGGLHYSDNGLSPSSQHSYSIEAIDSAGNHSVPTVTKLAAVSTTLAAGTVRIARGPYLADVTATSAVVSWWTNVASAGTVSYRRGSAPALQATDPSTPTQHHAVTLNGLAVGASYTYTVGNSNVQSTPATFSTAAGAGASFSFAAIGDYGGASIGETQNAANIASAGTSFIQTLGDNVYASAGNPEPDFSTTYSDYDARFFKQFGPAIRNQALFPANGNQEYYSSGKFWDVFPMPGANHSWYSYTWGDAHILVLDSEVAFDSASPQYAFAQADLAGHQNAAFRIVVMQRPPYSSSSLNSGSAAARSTLVPLFEKEKVALVLSGNSHNYERSLPLTAGKPTPGGVTYVVSGGGGNGHNTFTTPQPSWSAARDDTRYEYIKVSVSPTGLRINAIDAASDSVLDTATINATAAAPPVLSGPGQQSLPLRSTVTITGTATPGSTVAIFFRKRGQSSFTQRRSIAVGATGRFTTSYLADDDYRYYAAVGGAASTSQLRQILPTVNGALNRVVKRNATYTITGTSIPNTTVTIHFHRAGTALNDYSIARRVTVGGAGSWARPYLATTDYRLYVTSDANGTRSASYLLQAR